MNIMTAQGWRPLWHVGTVNGEPGTFEPFIPFKNEIGRGGKSVRRDFQRILNKLDPDNAHNEFETPGV